jgi:hypothetical protein
MLYDPKIPQARGTVLAAFICLAVILLWFSPWWLGGKNLAPLDLANGMMSPWNDPAHPEYARNHVVSDGVDQYLVYRMVAAENYAKEGWVGWSSLTYGGTPQYANTMALYFDWTMQLHRWFDFWTAWHLGLLGQVILAAGGMFLFLRGRGINALWAGCGALAYAANSQFVVWIYHRWALSSFCWVPWALWAIDSYRAGKKGFWPIVPLFIAMAFLGGTLQHAALVVLAVLAAWLEETIRTGKRLGLQFALLGRYAAWGLLACGLSAMMFLPCIDAFVESNRLGLHTGMTANAENSVYIHGTLQPLFNLLAYPFQIFPSVLGRSDSLDALKAFKSELFYVFYFGSLPVLLAFLALARKRAPLMARILIGAGLILPLTPLVRLLYQRLYLLFIIGGILAFAHFMKNAEKETRLRAFKVTSIVAAAAAGAWLALSLALAFFVNTDSLRDKLLRAGDGSSFGFYKEWIALRVDRFLGDLFIWSPQQFIPLALFVAALIGLRLTAAMLEERRRWGACLLAVAVIAEVSLFSARSVVWSDPVVHPLFPPTAESDVLRKSVGRDGRVTTLIHPTAHLALTPFVPNTLSAYGVPIIGGYDSIVPDGMILPNESPGDARKLGGYGVSHLITWAGNPEVPSEWRLVWQSPKMDLYENPLRVQRYAGFGSTVEKEGFFAGESREIKTLKEVSGLENSRLIEVPPGIRWIRIAENQSDGWEYRTEDSKEWSPVNRAPDASMLMENPQPTAATRLQIRYDPPLRKLGFAISGISLLVLAAGAMIAFRSHREPVATITR